MLMFKDNRVYTKKKDTKGLHFQKALVTLIQKQMAR